MRLLGMLLAACLVSFSFTSSSAAQDGRARQRCSGGTLLAMGGLTAGLSARAWDRTPGKVSILSGSAMALGGIALLAASHGSFDDHAEWVADRCRNRSLLSIGTLVSAIAIPLLVGALRSARRARHFEGIGYAVMAGFAAVALVLGLAALLPGVVLHAKLDEEPSSVDGSLLSLSF